MNVTIPSIPSGRGITDRQYTLLGLIIGLTLEIAVTGIISASVFYIPVTKPKQGSFGINWTAILMFNFNFACIIYVLNFSIDWFLTESNCVIGNLFGNSASHYFYLSFDVFVLFKTCVISGFNVWVIVLSGIVFANRVIWTILDIYKSGGYWDEIEQQCHYRQFPLSGIGYNASDMVCDLYCTVVSIIFSWKMLRFSSSGMKELIYQENVLRSFIMLCVNSYAMYGALTITDPFWTLAIFMIQNYTYARLLNLEQFWIGARRRKLLAPVDVEKEIQASIRKESIDSEGSNTSSKYLERNSFHGSITAFKNFPSLKRAEKRTGLRGSIVD